MGSRAVEVKGVVGSRGRGVGVKGWWGKGVGVMRDGGGQGGWVMG